MLLVMMEMYNNSLKKAIIQRAAIPQVLSKINTSDFFRITDHRNNNSSSRDWGLGINQISTLKILVAIINYLSPIEI